MSHKDEIKAAALAGFFSATVLKELASRGRSPALARLIRESGLDIDRSSPEKVGAIFDDAFTRLKRRAYRHEYVYKAALMHKVLLGIHSLKTASMVTEFRVGHCKADVVILNGTGTVYEIKSERDGLTRLSRQVDAYSRVFATVNVVVGEKHLSKIKNHVPDYVGLMMLSDRHQVSTLRAAIDDPNRTDPIAIFDAVNQHEASLILQEAGKTLPDVPNTQRYTTYRKMFNTLNGPAAHFGMVSVLKRTRNLRPLSGLLKSVPESLQAAIIATPLNNLERGRLVKALRVPIYEAVAWG